MRSEPTTKLLVTIDAQIIEAREAGLLSVVPVLELKRAAIKAAIDAKAKRREAKND